MNVSAAETPRSWQRFDRNRLTAESLVSPACSFFVSDHTYHVMKQVDAQKLARSCPSDARRRSTRGTVAEPACALTHGELDSYAAGLLRFRNRGGPLAPMLD